MHEPQSAETRSHAITKRPLLAVAICVLGFAVTSVHNTLPGAFPAMFLRGKVRLDLAEVGILSGILFVGVMLCGPIIGRLADRVGRKGPLIACFGIIALGTVGMATAHSYPLLLAARLLCGLGVGGVVPLLYAYLVDVLAENWRGPSSLGMAASGGASAFAVLFIVRATLATGPEGWRVAMWGFAALAVIAALCFALFAEGGKPAAPVAENATSRQVAPPASRLMTDHRRGFIAVVLAASCVGIASTGFFVMTVPILLARGVSEQAALGIVGISVVASMLSLAIAALISNRLPRYLMLSGGAMIGLAGLAVFAFDQSIGAATLGAAANVFGVGMCFGAVPFYAAEAFPEHLRGRATGLVSGTLGLFAAITPLITNLMLDAWGEGAPLLLMAGTLLLIPAVLLPFGPRLAAE